MGLLGGQKALGIALTGQALQLAEIRGAGGRFKLVHAAVFPAGEQRMLKDPAALGKELHQFLKSHGFSAKQAVAGFPAQWLMFKEKSLPAATPDATAGMLALQAERDFSLDPPSLALDFIPGAEVKGAQRVILAAAVRERIERVRQMAQAAGLNLRGITSSSLAIAGASGNSNVLYMGENGMECVVYDEQGLRAIRYLAPAAAVKGAGNADAAPGFAGELRRAAALSGGQLVSGKLTIWDDLGVDDTIAAGMFAGENVSLKRGEKFSALDSSGASEDRAAAGMALALCAAKSQPMGIDFLHSRLTPKAPSKFTSGRIWAAAAVLALLAGMGYLLLDWRQNAAELAELKLNRDEMKKSETTAKEFIARVKVANSWGVSRPNYLECLRAITLCFPEQDHIWASNLSMRDDMRGVMTGGAAEEKTVLDLLDRLKGNPAFAEVKMLQMRQSEGKNTEVTFSIAFTYLEGR